MDEDTESYACTLPNEVGELRCCIQLLHPVSRMYLSVVRHNLGSKSGVNVGERGDHMTNEGKPAFKSTQDLSLQPYNSLRPLLMECSFYAHLHLSLLELEPGLFPAARLLN